MTTQEDVIKRAIARYERERDRYLKLAVRVADICRAEIVEANAIRAQVTSRTKTARSLEGKLKRFASIKEKDISSEDAVFKNVGDFAGVRVATYRREDQNKVVDGVIKIFRGTKGNPPKAETKNNDSSESAIFIRQHIYKCIFLKMNL